MTGGTTGLHRVEWTVHADGGRLWVADATVGVAPGGETAWFESERPIRNSGEAMGTAALIPAMDAGLRATIGRPADSVWLEGATRATTLVREWWGYPDLSPEVAGVAPGSERASAVGLCFTCGVDSFYNLLFGATPVDALLYVVGYDTPLVDAGRIAAFKDSLAAVAVATGTRPLLVTTNLRETRALGSAAWERTHGAALAAVGHLLADHVGILIISATDHHTVERAWGSQWQLDPLWSSSRLAVVHAGREVERPAKVAALAESPLARRHLRVCWQHLAPSLNCGICEKCVRTQVMLAQAGALSGFEAFPRQAPVEDLVDALPPIRADALHHWAFTRRGLPAALEPAVRRLMERSGGEPRSGRLQRLRRRVRGLLTGR